MLFSKQTKFTNLFIIMFLQKYLKKKLEEYFCKQILMVSICIPFTDLFQILRFIWAWALMALIWKI